MSSWGGRRVTAARAVVATWLPMQCARCPRIVDGTEPWVIGHKIARVLRPDLMWDPANWQPEHRRCSDKTGWPTARAAAAARAGFSRADDHGSQAFPGSLPPGQGQAIATRPDLEWSPEVMRGYAWLAEFAEVPEDASPPLWMSRPPADAVCSYAWSGCVHGWRGVPFVNFPSAVEWIEGERRIRLRWWQRLGLARQLEHDADGALVHGTVLESGTRRIGKSVRIQGLALWRMAYGFELFGEPQTLVHTGKDLKICREIQRATWRWAEARGWEVTRGNGKEVVERPVGDRDMDVGDQWIVCSQDGVYGWNGTLGLVDEAWKVRPDTVDEGIEPTTLERSSAQLHLTSTAHRRATSTMRRRLQLALKVDDPRVLVLVWGAPPGSDPGDPAVWRAASAHWSESRRRMIASKYQAALAGQADPEADDPDPMAGFIAQYLNVWPLRDTSGRGDPIIDADGWDELAGEVPFAVPTAAAIEGWFGDDGVSVALAWRLEDGPVMVLVSAYADLAAAAAAVKGAGYRGVVTVGASMVTDPALEKLRVKPGAGRTADAVRDLGRLLGEDAVRHDGRAHLRDQVLAVRTVPGADGRRMSSTGRANAVKAAVWAIGAARASKGRQRLVLPTS